VQTARGGVENEHAPEDKDIFEINGGKGKA